jgi:hypothetical protein
MGNGLAVFVGFILLFILMLLFRLILISWGWDLFMTPVFGIRGITLSEAIGLALLLPSPSVSTSKK